MDLYFIPIVEKPLKICISTINSTYDEEDIYKINFLTIPTPTRLMGKDRNIIKKWRLHMNYKQKNKLLKNSDLYKDILDIKL